MNDKTAKLKEAWKNRTKVQLTLSQSKRLMRGKKVPVMVHGHFYELRVMRLPELYDSNGKKITASKLKAMLKVGKL